MGACSKSWFLQSEEVENLGNFQKSGKVREFKSTRMQKLTKVQKKFGTVVRRTVQKFFLLALHVDYLYLHF